MLHLLNCFVIGGFAFVWSKKDPMNLLIKLGLFALFIADVMKG